MVIISLSGPTESSSATDDGYYFPLPRRSQGLLRAAVPMMVVKIFLCIFNWSLIVLDTECVLCEVWTESLRSIYIIYMNVNGRAMVQAISSLNLTVEAGVRSWAQTMLDL